jgi:WD40 repeat protein
MKIWDISTGTCRCVCSHDESVISLQWHPSLPLIATASLDFALRLWDARSGTCLITLTGHRNLITNLDFKLVALPSPLPNSRSQCEVLSSVSDDGTVKIYVVEAEGLLE